MTALQEKKAGRKYKMASGILIASTAIMLMPGIMNLLGISGLIPLMTGGEYVSLIVGVFGLYVGGNVFQKKVLSQAGVSEIEAGAEIEE